MKGKIIANILCYCCYVNFFTVLKINLLKYLAVYSAALLHVATCTSHGPTTKNFPKPLNKKSMKVIGNYIFSLHMYSGPKLMLCNDM